MKLVRIWNPDYWVLQVLNGRSDTLNKQMTPSIWRTKKLFQRLKNFLRIYAMEIVYDKIAWMYIGADLDHKVSLVRSFIFAPVLMIKVNLMMVQN